MFIGDAVYNFYKIKYNSFFNYFIETRTTKRKKEVVESHDQRDMAHKEKDKCINTLVQNVHKYKSIYMCVCVCIRAFTVRNAN